MTFQLSIIYQIIFVKKVHLVVVHGVEEEEEEEEVVMVADIIGVVDIEEEAEEVLTADQEVLTKSYNYYFWCFVLFSYCF